MSGRIDQLDSIRGVASLFVLFKHLSLVTTVPVISLLLSKYSPLGVIANGSAAVIMFFVLSGFVLTLPFLKGTQGSYGKFLVKRIFRIYVPYLVSISISIALCALLAKKGGITELSEWFNRTWNDPITLKAVIEHALLIGNYNSNSFNNVLWSLIHEMRISIIFPLIAFLIVKLDWKWNVGICFALSALTGLNIQFGWEPSYGYYTSFMYTLHYSGMFILGGVFAKHRAEIVSYFRGMAPKLKWIVLAAAYICYHYSGVLKVVADRIGLNSFSELMKDYVTTTGALMFIVIAIGSVRVTALLLKKPIRFLGEISYSLYLYHLTILLSLTYLLNDYVPLFVIYLGTIVISVGVAKISYKYVEVPAMALGKRLTRGRPGGVYTQPAKGVPVEL